MTEPERIAAGPSDATLRMAMVMGVKWIVAPKWQRAILERQADT